MSLIDDLTTLLTGSGEDFQVSSTNAAPGLADSIAASLATSIPEASWQDIGYGWKGDLTSGMVIPAGGTAPVSVDSLTYDQLPIGEGGRRQRFFFGPSQEPLLGGGENYEASSTPSFTSHPLLFPGEEQSSTFGSTPFGSSWQGLDKAAKAVGEGVDYTMNEVVGSDLMKNISELTPLISKAIMTYAGGAPLVAALTAAETGAKGGDAGDIALNSALSYLASVGSQYAGAAMNTTPTTPSPTDAGFKLGGTEPLLNTKSLAVDQTLAPENIYGYGTSPEPSPFQIGGTEPYMNTEALGVNPGLAYENTQSPFVLGEGATPFKVNTALSPEATPVSTGDEWKDYVKWGKQLAKLLSGGGQDSGGMGTITEQIPGRSPDMSTFIELMSGSGIGTKPSKISSGEIPLLPYGQTDISKGEIGRYNPQQMYYA